MRMVKFFVTISIMFFMTAVFSACDGSSGGGEDKEPGGAYTVTYDVGIGNTVGTVPEDLNTYTYKQTVTVQENTGFLAGPLIRDGIKQRFNGWCESPDGSGTIYTPGSTFNITDNTTLYAVYTTDSKAVGKIGPAGGWIFYDDEDDGVDHISGGRYLEVAPVSTEWSDRQWGCYGYSTGIASEVIGSGKQNTADIVAWLNANRDDTYGDVTNRKDRAAYLCSELVYNGFNDWFFPSKDELLEIEDQIVQKGLGDFKTAYYSSSTESSESPVDSEQRAIAVFMNAITFGYALKTGGYRVRPVRMF